MLNAPQFNIYLQHNKLIMKTLFSLAISLSIIYFSFIACNNTNRHSSGVDSTAIIDSSKIKHLDWSKNATIYEVNIRQFTTEGTFNAFVPHLERLKKMGIDIIWLMPINPIGIKNRKGTMGSYYSIKDYKAVNPEFGTLDDFKNLVNKAHTLEMHVIIDWVANHSAWDNEWVKNHPDWYSKDSLGKMISPFDWTDVADLNYDNKELWNEMISSLKFWLTETNIDGFRCDVAELVPVEFWNKARTELDKVKPVFMLAEAEKPELHINAFDMTYGWELHFLLNSIVKGEKPLSDLDAYFKKDSERYVQSAYRMQFTSNHDENSWKGSEYERMGNYVKTCAVFTATIPGMALVYNGQESELKKRLLFFEKDTINWKNYELADFYTKLLNLKHKNEALWNNGYGGDFKRIATNCDSLVYAFSRVKNDSKVLVVMNFSAQNQLVKIKDCSEFKGLKDIFISEIFNGSELNLESFGYRVYSNKND